MAQNDDWVVVGGKGKPRKGTSQPAGVAAAAAGAAGDTCGAMRAAGPGPAPLQLPGWAAGLSGDSPGPEGHASSSSSSGSASRRQQRRAQPPRTLEERVAALAARVLDARREIEGHPVWAEVTHAMAAADQKLPGAPGTHWGAVRQLVVYGLGSVEESRNSRYQLALATLLQQLLPGLASPPQLYDPAFSPLDAALLRHLGMEVVGRDEGGRRPVDEPTLFYLPHCEGWLCDALLAANWSGEALQRLCVLGNSFGTYAERWAMPGSASGARPDHLLALVAAGAVLELPTRDHGFHVASAFNDMALHAFDQAGCVAACAAEMRPPGASGRG